MINLKTSTITACVLVTGAALASPSVSAAAPLKGTVVHANKRAHSVVIADSRGRLDAVHVLRMIAPGQTVALSIRKLRDGTFAGSKVRTGRRVHRTRLRGRVTYVNQQMGVFVVSARGASLLVHKHRRAKLAALAASAASDGLPAVGTEVTVSGTIDHQGDLIAESVNNDGQHSNYADLEGVILSVDTAARTVTISADDNDELAGASIVVHLPMTFNISSYQVGQVLEVVATLNPDGSYTAVETSDDDSAEQADKPECAQSEDKGDGEDIRRDETADESEGLNKDQQDEGLSADQQSEDQCEDLSEELSEDLSTTDTTSAQHD
jgi:hypothetical protein